MSPYLYNKSIYSGMIDWLCKLEGFVVGIFFKLPFTISTLFCVPSNLLLVLLSIDKIGGRVNKPNAIRSWCSQSPNTQRRDQIDSSDGFGVTALDYARFGISCR